MRVIWDNAPAHPTPELELRLVNLPGYSPDFNADEAVWGWAREEVTGLCLGSRAAVQDRRALSSEAVATVNRTVASGLERHRGVLAALGANDRVHFPTASVEAVVVALGSLGLAAGRTTLGLVGVALFSVVRLVISGEDEGLAALVTGEGSVRVSHSRPLFIR